MRTIFGILFWFFAICVIAVADYEEQPFYALFGTFMFASGFCYMYYENIKQFFNDK